MSNYPMMIQNLKDVLGNNHEERSAKVLEMDSLDKTIQENTTKLEEIRSLINGKEDELTQSNQVLTETRSQDEVDAEKVAQIETETRGVEDELSTLKTQESELSTELDAAKAEWRSLHDQLDLLEADAIQKQEELRKIEEKNMENIDKAKEVQTVQSEKRSLSNEIFQAIEENKNLATFKLEERNFVITNQDDSAGPASNLVPTTIVDFEKGLWDLTILDKLGIKKHNGKGILDIPYVITNPTAQYGLKEGEQLAYTDLDTAKLRLEGKRVATGMRISRASVINNTVVGITDLLMELKEALAAKIDIQFYAKLKENATVAKAGATNGNPINAKLLSKMRLTQEEMNIRQNGTAYITGPALKQTLYHTFEDGSNGQRVFDGNNINGVPVISTAMVKQAAKGTNMVQEMIYVSPSYVHMGIFGPLEVQVRYEGDTDEYVINLNTYVDFGKTHNESVAVVNDFVVAPK
ncbi:hypothetical protein [Marinifilum flexuosum]|uniref:phage major capsid protein n=1 Tax=Marinifilum flexuosum TaxID=1117708 RepID=UPI0024941AEA|nr:hypothetical protein [Marinifilum flexuosum]